MSQRGDQVTNKPASDFRKRLERFLLERVRLPLSVKHLHGRRRHKVGKSELVVTCLMRNAEAHIETFLAHYLRMGVAHIYLMDNGSTDSTVQIASRRPEVTIYSCKLPFKEHNTLMRRYLSRRFVPRGRWGLCVDVDELFDYPHSDKIDLAHFLMYLSRRGYTAVVAYLLDMFADKPLSDCDKLDGELKQACQFYDLSSITKTDYPAEILIHNAADGSIDEVVLNNTVSNSTIKHYTGGIRRTGFGLADVYLTKHPLFLNDGWVEQVHQHFVNHAQVADITCVLYHYKFVHDFRAKVRDALAARQYAVNSFEYEAYSDQLNRDPDMMLFSPQSQRLKSVNDLVHEEFLCSSSDYESWVGRCRKEA